MAGKVTGLNRRGSKWYVLIIVPPELRGAFDWPRKNFALHTSDRHEAVIRALAKRHEWAAAFQAKRRELNPQVLTEVTAEIAAALAANVRTFVLAADDQLRSDLPLLAEMVHVRRELDRRAAASSLFIPQWKPPSDRIDDLTGLTDAEAAELADLNAQAEGEAVIALARRNLAAVFPLVQAQAAKLGVSFDARTPGARDALLQCLIAYRVAHQEVTQRDAGGVVATPPLARAAPKKAQTLRDVFDRWKLSGDTPKSADAIAATDRALRQFEAQHPGTALTDITRDLGDKYRSWLRENCGTPKTARDRLNAVKSLLKYADQTLHWTTRHAWMGLDIKAKTTNGRRPWKEHELRTFFASPLHTTYTLPTARYAGQEAAYWIPLIGLFTGARLGEICQLRTLDVQDKEGITVLVLTDEGENQSIKSDAGRRDVPVHSELVRLGFLKYVAAVREAGEDSLWPSLPLRKGKPSDFFGRWFFEYRKRLGLTEKYPDFHCFRHMVRPLMRRAGHSEGTMDRVTGHATVGSVGTRVYDPRDLEEIQAAVEAIRHPALTLPVVAPSRGR